MTTTTVTGGWTIVQSGTAPQVQMQLASNGYFMAATNVYYQYPVQQSPTFVCTFQLWVISGDNCPGQQGSGCGDELFFFAGASAPLIAGVMSRTGTNNGGIVLGFVVYRFGLARGIYLMNAASTIVASADFSTDSAWEDVTISYTRGTSNTWVVSWKGSIVLTYSDPNNPSWVSSAGNYWGFGGRTGGASGNFYIRQVTLTLGGILQ